MYKEKNMVVTSANIHTFLAFPKTETVCVVPGNPVLLHNSARAQNINLSCLNKIQEACICLWGPKYVKII